MRIPSSSTLPHPYPEPSFAGTQQNQIQSFPQSWESGKTLLWWVHKKVCFKTLPIPLASRK